MPDDPSSTPPASSETPADDRFDPGMLLAAARQILKQSFPPSLESRHWALSRARQIGKTRTLIEQMRSLSPERMLCVAPPATGKTTMSVANLLRQDLDAMLSMPINIPIEPSPTEQLLARMRQVEQRDLRMAMIDNPSPRTWIEERMDWDFRNVASNTEPTQRPWTPWDGDPFDANAISRHETPRPKLSWAPSSPRPRQQLSEAERKLRRQKRQQAKRSRRRNRR